MAHGQPDFGMYAAKSTVGSMADNAELAARLGSIVTFDRKGDVMWFDNFEDNINKWVVIGSAVLSAETARNGGLSCKMETVAVEGAQVLITKTLPFPVHSRIGAELSLCHWLALVAEYRLNLYIYEPDLTTRRASWRYYPQTTDLQILDDALGWVSLGIPTRLQREFTLFHTIKIVGDFNTDRYVRLILDETTYDLSAYTMPLGGHAADPRLSMNFMIEARDDVAQSCYVDDVIFTQNEP